MTDESNYPHTPSFKKARPDGDLLERAVCERCGFIDYQNPKIVTGSVVFAGEKILMCKRAIEPRKGYWTLPAGYLELYETVEEGARREALEEACAKIEIDRVLAVFSIAHISQIQILYRARLVDPKIEPGPESEEVALFDWDDIPWTELAFPSVVWTLVAVRQNWNAENFAPVTNPPEGKYPFPLERAPQI